MPLPIPKKDEEKDEFLDRCMANDQAVEDFPDNTQRFAVCNDIWRESKEDNCDMSDKETRSFRFDLETREDDDGSVKIRGHAAVFNQEAEIWGFREQVAPGAFKDSIKEDDVRALFNHDPNFVLGRNTAGTLNLKEDKEGLAIEIDPPDTQFARDLQVSIRRGDISQMSFGFQVLEEEWKDGGEGPDERTLKKVRLFDVSPVTFPAYEGTDVAVRSHDKWQEQNKPKRNKVNLKRKRLNILKEGK